MTPEQTAAISACIEAFRIPRDCRNFKLVIETSDRHVLNYGAPKHVCAFLEVDHYPARAPDVI